MAGRQCAALRRLNNKQVRARRECRVLRRFIHSLLTNLCTAVVDNLCACSCRAGSAAFTGRRWRPLRKAGEPASFRVPPSPPVGGVHFCCDGRCPVPVRKQGKAKARCPHPFALPAVACAAASGSAPVFVPGGTGRSGVTATCSPPGEEGERHTERSRRRPL